MIPDLKQNIKTALRDILQRAFIPQVLITIFCVLLHWILVSIWLYYNYDDHNGIKLFIISLLGGSLPILAYGIWGLRRFIIKSYLIIHDKIIRFWLQDFCDEVASKLIKNRETIIENNQPDEIITKFKAWTFERIENLPIFIKKITLFVVKRMGVSNDMELRLNLLKEGKPEDVSDMVHEEISNLLIESSNNLIPAWIIYLVPINILLLIGLWFL